MGLGSYLPSLPSVGSYLPDVGSWWSSNASKATRAADLIAKKALAFPQVPAKQTSTAVASTVPETVTTTPASSTGGSGAEPESETRTESSDDTSEKEATVHFRQGDIKFDDVMSTLTEAQKKEYTEAFYSHAKAKAKEKKGREPTEQDIQSRLDTMVTKAAKRERRQLAKDYRRGDDEDFQGEVLGKIAAEQYERVKGLSELMNRKMTERQLQSVVRGRIKRLYGDVSDIEMSGWEKSAKPCPNTGWMVMSGDEHMKDERAKDEFREKLKTTEGLSEEDLSPENFDKMYRKYASRYHEVDLDGPLPPGVKESFGVSELSTRDRDPEKWTSEERALVLGAIDLETQLAEYGASAGQIEVARERYILENTKSHVVEESADGSITFAYNPFHLKAGGVRATYKGLDFAISCSVPNPSAPQTTVLSALKPFEANGEDIKNDFEFEKERAEISKRPPKLKHTATTADSATGQSIKAAVDDWAKSAQTGITQDNPNGPLIMMNQLVAADKMSKAFEETYKFDRSSATQLSQWVSRCQRKGWTWGKSATDPSKKEIVFKQKRLKGLEDDLTEFCKSAGITTIHTPRQIMVTGIKAMEDGTYKAWDGTDLDEWMLPPKCRAEGSESPTVNEVTGRLLKNFKYSTLLDSMMPKGPGHLSPDQRGLISTYLADQPDDKIQGELQRVLQNLKENPNWAPSKDYVAPPTDTTTAATSQPPASSQPAATTTTPPSGNRPADGESSTPLTSQAEPTNQLFPKLVHRSMQTTSPGEQSSDNSQKSLEWSIYEKKQVAPEDALREAHSVLPATFNLRERYPELDWNSAARLAQWIDKAEDLEDGQTYALHGPAVKFDISKYMKDAGVTTEVDPEEVIYTVDDALTGELKSWTGLSLPEWAAKPLGNDTSCSKSDQFQRFVQLDQISSTMADKMPKKLKSHQEAKWMTHFVDMSLIMPGKTLEGLIQAELHELKKDSTFAPSLKYIKSLTQSTSGTTATGESPAG